MTDAIRVVETAAQRHIPTHHVDTEALKDAMRRRGISASELAERAKITPETIWRALRGYPVLPRTAQRLANALNAIPIVDGIEALLGNGHAQPRVVRIPQPRRPMRPDEGLVPAAVDGVPVVEETSLPKPKRKASAGI